MQLSLDRRARVGSDSGGFVSGCLVIVVIAQHDDKEYNGMRRVIYGSVRGVAMIWMSGSRL